nr:MAG TPA: SurA N-terminal domain [Caudoviricetes sp.]
MEAVKNFLWRLLVAAAIIIFYFAAASCVPDKAPAVPVSDIAAEPVTEQDAAEAMPIARGIYPDLPYEPTNEDLEAAR